MPPGHAIRRCKISREVLAIDLSIEHQTARCFEGHHAVGCRCLRPHHQQRGDEQLPLR